MVCVRLWLSIIHYTYPPQKNYHPLLNFDTGMNFFSFSLPDLYQFGIRASSWFQANPHPKFLHHPCKRFETVGEWRGTQFAFSNAWTCNLPSQPSTCIIHTAIGFPRSLNPCPSLTQPTPSLITATILCHCFRLSLLPVICSAYCSFLARKSIDLWLQWGKVGKKESKRRHQICQKIILEPPIICCLQLVFVATLLLLVTLFHARLRAATA